MKIVKAFVILGLLALGSISLLTGIGVEIPLVKYKEIEAHGVPAGLALVIAAVAIAYFWRIETTTSISQTSSNGRTIITKIVTTTKSMGSKFGGGDST